MSLHIDYRPRSLKEVIGNESIKESLSSVLERDKPPSTFMFTGPGGTGKTTLARIVAEELGCSKADILEINASSETGIDAIRKIAENLRFSPLHGDKKAVIMDEAHMLSKNSQEALLKTLEEPPSYVHIMICTTNPESLKPTFKRRCHQYELSLLKPNEISSLIKRTLVAEKVDIKKFPRSVVELIIDLADGSAGQAMKLLDMVIDMDGTERMIETINSVGVSSASPEVIDICRLLLSDDMSNKTRWMRLQPVLKDLKGDGESARRAILGYMDKVILGKDFDDAAYIASIMSNFTENYFSSGKSGLILSCYLCCSE